MAIDEKEKREINNPWTFTADDILNELNVSSQEGLSTQEAKKRLNFYGENKLKGTEKKSVWVILFNQFKSLIVLLLIVAAVLSFTFDKQLEGLAIIAVILLNAALGFFTELKAVKSMEALRELSNVKVKVRRDGKVIELDAQNIVPGDIIILESGDIITADLRILESSKLQADESPLTGESVPVTKQKEKLSEKTELAERNNMLYKGTSLTRGSGKAVVITTGMKTELGNISTLVEEAEEETTPIEKKLDKLGNKLIWVTIGITAVVALIGIIRGKDIFLMVESAIALAVAAIPEGLPIVATIALARGMMRMARRNALINKLASVETLGATNIICTDKTGTLTENKMTLREIRTLNKKIEVTGEGYQTEGKFKVRRKRF